MFFFMEHICQMIGTILYEYYQKIDWKKFDLDCNNTLSIILKEQDEVKRKLKKLIKGNTNEYFD